MEDFARRFREKKPNISESSLRTYYSLIKNLHKNLFDSAEIDYDNLDKDEKVVAYLNDFALAKRKTTAAALLVLTQNKAYDKLMREGIRQYNSIQSTGEKSAKQKENWIEMDEIKTIFADYEKKFKKIIKQPFSLQNNKEAQYFISLLMTAGIFHPPRRSLDWTELKIENIDKEKDNFIDFKKNVVVYNVYKQSAKKGQYVDNLNSQVKKYIKAYLKYLGNQSEYLLHDTKFGKINSVKLSQRLNKVFRKNVSTTMLRHIYLSSRFSNVNELREIANDMGSSLNMVANVYIKK